MALVAPREHGADASEDATPVLRRPQHAKVLPGCQQGERAPTWHHPHEGIGLFYVGERTLRMPPGPSHL